MLQLEQGLLGRLNFEQAVQEEIDRPPDRLPSRIVEAGVAGHISEYAEKVKGQCTAGFNPSREEIVWMPKARQSYRPISALPLLERVLYRALAADLAANTGQLDAYARTQNTFASSLLEDDEEELIQYVVIADVTSFYRYVSHSLLERRIVEATARADLARASRAFLDVTMNSEIGLPQNLGPSDLFADLILKPVERRLLRAGVPATRFNDDFRLGARTLTGAREALELLQREAHAVGLSLNESKTNIMKRDRYASHIGDLMMDEYIEGEDAAPEPTPDAINEAVVDLANELQIPEDRREPRSRLEEARSLARIRRLLRRLSGWGTPAAVGLGRPIINTHPSLTQNYARYAQAVSDAAPGEIADYLNKEIERLVLTPWQEMWLLEPLVTQNSQPDNLAKWIVGRTEAPTQPLLQSRALLAATRAGLVDQQLALTWIDSVPSVAQPDVIAGYAAASPQEGDKTALGGLPDSDLAGWIFDLCFLDWDVR